ncbi:hypothetical protein B0T20DRAFT_416731 [Sordaria brevicollis]|uniref:Uncharacterized protein n=1 Tax=Sordaria brevicollis TaxID=83679 RepID=A0AAE0U9Q5_SORBR|nr:hypothetical protein B0T20DRAFT_416731 [Sordaria brevicollis]
MKLTTATILIGLLAGLAAAQGAPEVTPCPTVTRTMQNRGCGKTCQFTDCAFVSTVRNPCGCPASVPTATLIAPCEADCPYGGCSIKFRTSALTCPATTTSTTRRWPPWQTRTSTATSSSPPPKPTSTRTTTVRSTSTSTSYTQTTISWSIITLPPKTTSKPSLSTTTPCPTVTKTTSPADCSPIRCPVPTCQVRSTLNVPCGCTVKTLLYVQGCTTTCSEGCLTRTETASATGC